MDWVVLTPGGRPAALEQAVASLMRSNDSNRVLVISNGAGATTPPAGARVVESATNRRVPGGRDLGIEASVTGTVGFLDDDAEFRGNTVRVQREFDVDASLGAVSFRLVDENGSTSRRHVPRAGSGHPSESGEVAYFLGSACAIRREAYEQVGGYFTELFYGHEEIELGWWLIDAGWRIHHLADVEVFHLVRRSAGTRWVAAHRSEPGVDRSPDLAVAGCGRPCHCVVDPRCWSGFQG